MSRPGPVSIVIPVRNGVRYLHEVLTAIGQQAPDAEVLVLDSGSADGSREVATAAGARVVRIAPGEFGHGRTRNRGAELTSGEVICFLTQDATPAPGWLDALLDAFSADDRIGVVFGPHLPRPDTPPMIARELTQFFARLRPEDPYLSNVNAAYRRACWEQIRFRDVAYAEDQAFGRDLLGTAWTKVLCPRAAVLHAHDYGLLGFMRRYFDEARGLRETTGWVEPIGLRATAGGIRRLVGRDVRWMRARRLPLGRRVAWTLRSVLHHAGRKVFAWLGSRADRLPRAVRRALSLEGRAN